MTPAEFAAAVELGKSRSDCHSSNIDSLVQIVNSLRDVPGDIAECGSYRCGASIAMAATAELHPTGKEVYAFDLFGGLPYGDSQKGFENFAGVDFEETVDVTDPFPNLYLVQGLHETTIPKFVQGNHTPLSLIFMDSDFYESHKVCLTHLWPLLSSKGMVVFHDWSFPGVQQAIAETIPTNEIAASGTLESSPNMGYIVKK